MSKRYNYDRELRKQEKLKYREYKLKKHSVNSNYKKFVQSNFKTGFSIFALIALFMLLISLTRRISNGSPPTFTGLLSFLSSFEYYTLPFNTNTGVGLLDFLTFIFNNVFYGFQIFFGVIKFIFFG